MGAWKKLIDIYTIQGNARGACNALIRSTENADPPLAVLSSMANLVNGDRSFIESTDVSDRQTLIRPLAGLMEQHLREASPIDLWRLAWLHLHSGNKDRALEVAEMGLRTLRTITATNLA